MISGEKSRMAKDHFVAQTYLRYFSVPRLCSAGGLSWSRNASPPSG